MSLSRILLAALVLVAGAPAFSGAAPGVPAASGVPRTPVRAAPAWDVVIHPPAWNGREHSVAAMEADIRGRIASPAARRPAPTDSPGRLEITQKLTRLSVAEAGAWNLVMGLEDTLVVLPPTGPREGFRVPVRAWGIHAVCRGDTCRARHVLQFVDFATAERNAPGGVFPDDTLWTAVSNTMSGRIGTLVKAIAAWSAGSVAETEALLADESGDTRGAVVEFLGQAEGPDALRLLGRVAANDAWESLRKRSQALIERRR